jgi:[citrate (pro-3S)-lyase] ligase
VELETGFPFRGEALAELRGFLSQSGLRYDEGVEFSVLLRESGRIAAAGSLDGRVLKCIAVAKEFQGAGAAAQIVTELVNEAVRRGISHLFLFTNPEREDLFVNLGFYPISKTPGILLMENERDGVKNFVKIIAAETPPLPGDGEERKTGKVRGAVVVNCNPFSLGHRYLIENAAAQCALLHVFVVAEDKSAFPAAVRFNLVRAGTADLPNVRVHSTGPYLISSVTFPDYFLKDSVSPEVVHTELDLAIFAEHFARPLGIGIRFAGTEDRDPVTQKYNRQMAEILPRYGIRFIEIPRLESGGEAISAGRIRKLLAEKNYAAMAKLAPKTTMEYLLSIKKTEGVS